MVDAINYAGMLPQIDLTPLQRGLQVRDARKDRDAVIEQRKEAAQLAKAQFEYDTKKDADYLSAVQAYDGTPEGLRDLAFRFPEQADRLLKAGDSYTTRQKQDLIGDGFATIGAISNGNSAVAIDTLNKRREGLKNSGIDPSHTDAVIQLLKDGKFKEATKALSYIMSGLVGADHTASLMETLGVGGKADDRRADNARADAAAAETARHNRVVEGQGAGRLALSQAAGARADRKAAGGGSGGGRQMKLPSGFVLDN